MIFGEPMISVQFFKLSFVPVAIKRVLVVFLQFSFHATNLFTELHCTATLSLSRILRNTITRVYTK